jgi:hypothetical protein
MSEHANQVALITWARMKPVIAAYPGIDLLEASLNGVKLTKAQAGKAKAAGMLKGALDLNLPVARGPYHGMRIEMKFGKNDMTDEQRWHAKRLQEEGWKVVTCWTWTEARDAIVEYLMQLELFDSCVRCGSKNTQVK